MKKRPAKKASVEATEPWPVQPPAEMPKLKGLSIRQPFAEQIMRGEKTEEYRSVACKIRGRIYIYAGLGRYPPEVIAEIKAETGLDSDDFPRGVVVGTVEVVDCSPLPDYGFAWHLANPIRLAEPLAPLEHPQPMWFHPFGKP